MAGRSEANPVDSVLPWTTQPNFLPKVTDGPTPSIWLSICFLFSPVGFKGNRFHYWKTCFLQGEFVAVGVTEGCLVGGALCCWFHVPGWSVA